jgi:RNA polymerase sigma-70 factor (ECF subfamily)
MTYTLPSTGCRPICGPEGLGEVWGAAQGKRQAFEAEILPHLDAAYRLARILSGRQDEAEDLVQEACLRAFAGFGGYQRGTNARAWLLTILRRVFLNDRRRLRAQPFLLSLGKPDENGEFLDPADTSSLGPEEQTLRDLDRAEVLAALAELPEVYRTVLALVDLEGLRYAEAAAVLECPPGTVMSRLYRGRQQLAQRLRSALPAGEGVGSAND